MKLTYKINYNQKYKDKNKERYCYESSFKNEVFLINTSYRVYLNK